MAFDNNTALTFAENTVPDLGVDVSYLLAMQQVIYADRSTDFAMVEAISSSDYIPFSASYPLSVTIYDPGNTIVTKINIQTDLNALKESDFQMYAGDSKVIEVTVSLDATPVDLSGATIKWVLKRSAASPVDLVSKSNISGISITDSAHGKFDIILGPADTEALKYGWYYHEAELTDAAGNVSTVTTGTITMMASGV